MIGRVFIKMEYKSDVWLKDQAKIEFYAIGLRFA